MKIMKALLLVWLLTIFYGINNSMAGDEDYFYIRAGLGKNFMFDQDMTNQWEAGGGVGGNVGFGYVKKLTESLYGFAGYDHYSQPLIPSSQETTSDHLFLGLEYRIY